MTGEQRLFQFRKEAAMLYIAFVTSRTHTGDGGDLQAKSRKWWNEGGKPAGLNTVSFYGALGSSTHSVIVFEAASHEDIRAMINYWGELEFDVHPAIDLAEVFRKQGMHVG
jgi:hypothetical protein